MTAGQLEALDLAPTRVRSPQGIRAVAAPWLTFERNERLAEQHAADGALCSSPTETEAAFHARAGWKTIEIFVALLPIGWG
jgi:hypothetical protein